MDEEFLNELSKELEHIEYNLDNYPKDSVGDKSWHDLKRQEKQMQSAYDEMWNKVYGAK